MEPNDRSLPFFARLTLAWKILFNFYGHNRIYHNPSVGISEIHLRHKKYNWRR